MPRDVDVARRAIRYIRNLGSANSNLAPYVRILEVCIPASRYAEFGCSVNTFNRNFMDNRMSDAAFALALMKAHDNEDLIDTALRHVTSAQVIVKLRSFKPNKPQPRVPTLGVPMPLGHTKYRRPAPAQPGRNLQIHQAKQKFNKIGKDQSFFIISGHGSLEYDATRNCWPRFRLPRGVTMRFYTPLYYELGDTTGGQIDRMTLPNGPKPRYHEVSASGGMIYDYTLHAANPHQTGGDIKLRNHPIDPRYYRLNANAQSIRLSAVISGRSNIGRGTTLHWAACRVVHYKNHYVDAVTGRWGTTTTIY